MYSRLSKIKEAVKPLINASISINGGVFGERNVYVVGGEKKWLQESEFSVLMDVPRIIGSRRGQRDRASANDRSLG